MTQKVKVPRHLFIKACKEVLIPYYQTQPRSKLFDEGDRHQFKKDVSVYE